MRYMMMPIGGLCFIAWLAAPNMVSGQQNPRLREQIKDKTPAVLVIVDRSAEYPAVTVVRRASTSPSDVIVIPRGHLDAAFLARAALRLQLSRRSNGLKPTRDEKHRLGPADDVPNNPYLKPAEVWVRLIQQSDKTNVPGFGLAQAMTIFLTNNDPAVTSK